MHKFHQFAINVKYLLSCMILPGIFITTSPEGPEQIILPSLKESSIGRQGYASLRTYTYSLPSFSRKRKDFTSFFKRDFYPSIFREKIVLSNLPIRILSINPVVKKFLHRKFIRKKLCSRKFPPLLSTKCAYAFIIRLWSCYFNWFQN